MLSKNINAIQKLISYQQNKAQMSALYLMQQ